MTIHHAVQKKAAKHRVTITPVEGGFQAAHADLPQSQLGKTPTEALGAALQALGYTKPKRTRPPGAPRVKASGKKAKKAAVPANKSVVRKEYKAEYKKTASGQGNGDRLDQAIRDYMEGDGASYPKLAKENNVPFVWQVLNPGLQRMNLTNVLRARIRRSEKVTVDGKTVASL